MGRRIDDTGRRELLDALLGRQSGQKAASS
jgi:hypothetical protein